MAKKKIERKRKKEIYNLEKQEVFSFFQTGETGLAQQEAKARLKKSGLNRIRKKQNWFWLRLLGHQFNDALVWILLVAGALALAFGEMRDVAVILTIVFINAAIGFFQEYKAERIIRGINRLVSQKAVVIRAGQKKEIESKFLVPGDVVSLTGGDKVPADGYLIEAFNLLTDSFIFTGESRPEMKFAKANPKPGLTLADIDNMVFTGEVVMGGEARFVVCATGMETELGRIAGLTWEVKDEPTPMQKQMRELGRNVSVLAVLIGILVMIGGQLYKMTPYENFLFALALAMSVVPEGLPAAISMALSNGMKRLLGKNVLAKKLNAVETLGSVSVICTDKTGTITKNELVVTKVSFPEKEIEVDGNGFEPKGYFTLGKNILKPQDEPALDLILKIGYLCNGAELVHDDDSYHIIGDPTEGALIVAAEKYFQNGGRKLFDGEEKRDEIPFSSERMRMSAVYENEKKEMFSYMKGSPEKVLELCRFYFDGKSVRALDAATRERIREKHDQMSQEALRVLGFAYKKIGKVGAENFQTEKQMVWVGMMAMLDAPRPGVEKAIRKCQEMGIRVIMITGDYEVTARAIAAKVGLIDPRKEYLVITGSELEKMSDRKIYEKINNIPVVFARITPKEKLRIGTILKDHHWVIAMTGDGVNDAPVLKKADIGVAMGKIGTDVAKEAADMILLDDNFSSIVEGVRLGRTIYRNLIKFVHYVFTSNAGELFTVIFGVIMQIPAPISAIQILAIDLGTDIFPSFSLGVEPEEPGIGREKKINSRSKIMTFERFRRILYIGVIMAVGAVAAFVWSMTRGGWSFGEQFAAESLLYIKSTSAAYSVLAVSQMANLLQSRSETLPVFKLGFFRNPYAIGAIFISLGILLAFLYLPFFQKYLKMSPIDGWDWLVVLITTIAVFVFEEVRKSDNLKRKKNN